MSTTAPPAAETAEPPKPVESPLKFTNCDDHGNPLPQARIDAYKQCSYGPGAYYDTEE